MNATLPTYDDAPRIVIWETTRACALACRHCRATAIPRRNADELSTQEAFELVDAVRACGDPIFILTGGDPFMRDDLEQIVGYAAHHGLRVAVSPSATGRLRPERLRALAAAGCSRISLSIDAPDAAAHDGFRGVRGSFERTLRGIADARNVGLEVQINTTISRFNAHRIGAMGKLLQRLEIALWSVFFLVPVGRAVAADVLSADETEAAFAELHRVAARVPFPVKTTEAPHYRRFLMQHATPGTPHHQRTAGDAPPRFAGIGDGRGFVFVSHVGEICPSGFLPLVVGNVRAAGLLDVYRDHPTMRRLRDPDSFGGKCGVCQFRNVCGGSRARAYTMTGDPFAAEPTCAYIPPRWEAAHA